MSKTVNIDRIDEQILHELQADARRPNRALAEAASVSPSTMVSRVRSLEERGVIKGYHAEVDLQALDRHVEALVSVRLDAKTPEAIDEFIETIWKLDATISVTLLTGAFDFVVHITARDVADLGDIVLNNFACAPNVAAEQTAIIFDHRRKHTIGSLRSTAP